MPPRKRYKGAMHKGIDMICTDVRFDRSIPAIGGAPAMAFEARKN